jgi:small subunit ribosomal protein S6
MSLNKYHSTVILDTRGREESVDVLIENLKKEIAAVHGKVLSASNDGHRPFARVTDHNFTGSVFVGLDIEAPGTFPSAIRERVRLNKSIYRVLVQRA